MSGRRDNSMKKHSELPNEITSAFDEMFAGAQTKLIAPAIAYTVVRLYEELGKDTFTAIEISHRYQPAVCELVHYAGTNLHLGAKFDTAYISREDRGVGRHGILRPIGSKRYKLSTLYQEHASVLTGWIPNQIKIFLERKLGQVIKLGITSHRLELAEDQKAFLELLRERTEAKDSGTSFEIVSFAILKIYLDKFACRIYRDTRTFTHEGGTDLSTDFGAVYQIKKLKIARKHEVDMLYTEIKNNFDTDRIQDGRVVLIIDDITPDCKTYLLKKNSLKYFQRSDLLEIATLIRDPEDRQKVLRVIYDEFCREYANDICARHNCDGHQCHLIGKS